MDPFRLPVFLDDSAINWDFYYLARALFGALATYVFARAVRLDIIPSLTFAIGYTYSGHFMIFGNNLWIEVYYLLPVILLGSELLVGGHPKCGFLITSVGIGLSILAGMPEATFFVLLLAAAYGAYRALVPPDEWAARGSLLKRAIRLGGAWGTGLALGAPLILPFVQYVPLSFNAHPAGQHMGLGAEPLADSILWGIPFLKGLSHAPVDPNSGIVLIQSYAGMTVLMLALFSVIGPHSRFHRRLLIFPVAAVILLLAKTYGAPGINAVGYLPGFDMTSFPKWSAPVTGFCLTFLAALGVQGLMREKVRLPSIVTVAFATAAFIALGLAANRNVLSYATTQHLNNTVGAALLFASALVLVLVARHWSSGKLAAIGCFALVALELWFYAPHGVYQDRYNPLEKPPFVSFLQAKAQEGPFRVFGINGILFPDFASAYGLDDIQSLDALYISRYLSYIQTFVAPSASDRYIGSTNFSGERPTVVTGNPWFNLANIRYVITPPGDKRRLSQMSLVNSALMADLTASDGARVSETERTIDGITKPVLLTRSPSTIRFPLTVTRDNDIFFFSPVLRLPTQKTTTTGGARFLVTADVGADRASLYTLNESVVAEASKRHWANAKIDLSRYVGRHIVLQLTTLPDGSLPWEPAGWAGARLMPASGGIVSQYRKVYSGEVDIYENQDVLPRAFFARAIVPVNDEASAIAAMEQPGLNPAKTAVVEDIKTETRRTVGGEGGKVRFTRYESGYAALDVTARGNSFLVLTDSYYPGWIATIDGHATRIYATDLAFRGIFVPAGHHVVRFVYRPASFTVGALLALAGLAVLVAVAVGWIFRHQAPRGKTAGEGQS